MLKAADAAIYHAAATRHSVASPLRKLCPSSTTCEAVALLRHTCRCLGRLHAAVDLEEALAAATAMAVVMTVMAAVAAAMAVVVGGGGGDGGGNGSAAIAATLNEELQDAEALVSPGYLRFRRNQLYGADEINYTPRTWSSGRSPLSAVQARRATSKIPS